VVMAHGFGATRDSGLEPYFERFAAAGLDVLVFDYRHLGASPGEPRQLVSWPRQRRDYHAALACARGLPGVDPDRIVLWGTSYSGGHVIAVAAEDGRVAAAISQGPDADAVATLIQVARYAGPKQVIRMVGAGLRDLVRSLRDREPHMIPTAGEPGTLACMTTEDSLAGNLRIAGPTWRNEICARVLLDAARNRPTALASRIRCPLLVQVAEFDEVTPPGAARRAAWKARKHGRPEVRGYPIGHFEFYLGETFERVVADQLHFLERHLAAQAAPAAV
jgi:uncharacterized protein